MTRETLTERIDRLWRATGRYTSERDFLRRCHVSQGYLSQLKSRLEKNAEATVELEPAVKMARELGISIEDLCGYNPLHVTDDRYPTRGRAVLAARLLNYPESVIAAVMAESPPTDPGARYWYRRIDAAEEAARAGVIGPSEPPRRGRRGRQRVK